MCGEPQRLFATRQRVRLTEAPFADIQGIYLMADGEQRAMALMCKPVTVAGYIPSDDIVDWV